MPETSFRSLLVKYTANGTIIDTYWKQVFTSYTEPHRCYHTLAHLNHLLNELTGAGAHIINRDALLFALYYHDIIYEPMRGDNEERSALMAKNAMEQLAVPDSIINTTCIRATRSHALNDDPDINYFTDADLSVLGQAPVVYKTYCEGIRKEYGIYPDVFYQRGRKNVLSAFIQRSQIFNTAFFYNKYETQARINIAAEIAAINELGYR